MEQSTSKFNELNFNLKNIIFSFVNPLNLLKIRSNSYCRKLMDENHQSFNKYSIFYFLYNLKFNQNVLHDVDSLLNFYNETNLIEIVKKRFNDVKEDDIVLGLCLYFLSCKREFFKNKIFLDFHKKEEIILFEKILDKLGKNVKNMFKYIIQFPKTETVNFNEPVNINIFKKIRYIDYIKPLSYSLNDLFKFLKKNEINLSFYNLDNFINISKFDLTYFYDYFVKFPNNLETIDGHSLEILTKHNFSSFKVISESINQLLNTKNDHIEIFSKFVHGVDFPNIEKIHLIDPIDETYDALNKNFPNFSKIKFSNTYTSKSSTVKCILLKNLQFDSSEVNLSDFKYHEDTIEKLIINTSNGLENFNLENYLVFKNLKFLELNVKNNPNYLHFGDIFKINCTSLWKDVEKVFEHILQNNQNEIKNIYIETSKLGLLHESLDLLKNEKNEEKFKSIFEKIKVIKLTDKSFYGLTKFKQGAYFKDLHQIEIENKRFNHIINYTKTLDRLILRDKNQVADLSVFQEIKNKNLKMFEAGFCDLNALFQFIDDNPESFKNLKFINIRNLNRNDIRNYKNVTIYDL